MVPGGIQPYLTFPESYPPEKADFGTLGWGAATPMRGWSRGGGGSTVTTFQLESMYASYVPSLSFVGQTEAKLQNCPPLPACGGSDPLVEGGVGVGGQQSLFFNLSPCMQSLFQV